MSVVDEGARGKQKEATGRRNDAVSSQSSRIPSLLLFPTATSMSRAYKLSSRTSLYPRQTFTYIPEVRPLLPPSLTTRLSLSLSRSPSRPATRCPFYGELFALVFLTRRNT